MQISRGGPSHHLNDLWTCARCRQQQSTLKPAPCSPPPAPRKDINWAYTSCNMITCRYTNQSHAGTEKRGRRCLEVREKRWSD
ncbi:hypothetical protein E2C01_077802 [Portunus trituberculatus]|uniref:Uncharacterized protein n=1 Tax=Portunus trituberculatus TaxID=210409 RepID=A0A5B7ICD4_PORTR|nr:hypothetical protein [Portunus trituberculatus]